MNPEASRPRDAPVTLIEVRVMHKVLRRFVPLLVLSFVFCFINRINVGFAALTMSRDLGFTATVFGIGAGIFFVGYCMLEVPSNMMLVRVGARWWIARIMFSWGIVATATAFVWNAASFYAVRVLLGIAEAGFFPGVILFLTYWVPARYRARVMSWFMVSMPLASVIGSPTSGYLMSLDGLFGLRGWQLLYIADGLPSVVLAFVVLFVLRDSPAKAEWLSAEERLWLEQELLHERQQNSVASPHGLFNILRDPRIVLLSAAYFGLVGSNFALNFYLPQIVHGFSLGLRQTGLLAAIPFVVAVVGMIYWGRSSDAHGERTLHLLVPMVLAVIGLAGSTWSGVPAVKLALLCLAALGVFSALPVYWASLPSLLSPASAAITFAAVNSIGNLAGFAAPYVVGVVKDATGSFNGGLQLIAGYGCIGIAIVVLVARHESRASGHHRW
jgi:MFS transporter, ACS family, tartrate transporter